MSIKKSKLFKNFKDEDIDKFILESSSKSLSYSEDSYVFQEGELPEYLFILLSGAVQVEKVDFNGNKTIVNLFNTPGTVFGEVYLFMDKKTYDYSCQVIRPSKILLIPKYSILNEEKLFLSSRLKDNMLSILAEKAFQLNQKLLISSSRTLRQKLATYFIQRAQASNKIQLDLNREDLASYIGTTRPSLSRELMAMEKDSLIHVTRDLVIIKDFDKLLEISQ